MGQFSPVENRFNTFTIQKHKNIYFYFSLAVIIQTVTAMLRVRDQMHKWWTLP